MKKEIMEGYNKSENLRHRALQKAPYYPKVYKTFIEWESYTYKDEETGEKVKEVTSYMFYATAKVRHKHEGTWYARHHLQTYRQGFETFMTTLNSEIFEQIMKELRHNVYLDIKFGSINPDLKRPNGGPVDPVDFLQTSELKRLNLK